MYNHNINFSDIHAYYIFDFFVYEMLILPNFFRCISVYY